MSRRAHEAAYGRTETQRLATAGLLGKRCTAMHVGDINDADVAALHDTSTTVNHNPLGNAMLGFGTASQGAVQRLLTAGVPLVLGSDYTPSMVATPFDMIRAALMMAREVTAADDALRLEEALAMATNPGVSVGQPGHLGRIAAGQLADLVIIDTPGPHHLGSRHPVPALALRARPGDVRTVVVNGHIVVDNGQLTNVDERAVIGEAEAAFSQLVR